MSPPRLVLVTRRFWPLVGGAETMMARLAAQFQALGAHTTVLTARWQADWPIEIERQGVRVVRLANPQTRGWGTWRYMQALSHWLWQNRAQFDLVYVSMLKHDAYAALGQGRRSGFPVVLRAEGAGATGDCRWQEQANFGRLIRNRCRRAAAIVALSPAIREELLQAGYAAGRIHDIANGVPLPPPRDDTAQRAARRSLAEAYRGLDLPPAAPLALFTGRLDPRKGLFDLVDAWARVVARYPAARLWIVGDGPARSPLVARIDDLGLSGQVVLPGAFDDVEDFLAAADLFVLPSLEEGISVALLEAMAAGLPVVASDIAGNRAIVENRSRGLLVPPAKPPLLAAAVEELLARPDYARQLGTAGRTHVAAEFSLERKAREHLALFEQLLSGRRVE